MKASLLISHEVRLGGKPRNFRPFRLSLRRAMIAVVEQGTARGSRLAALTIAGKTGTSQNPHGPDHGWFIAFAPADKPEVVVGAIIEFSQHVTSVAPLVSRAIAH